MFTLGAGKYAKQGLLKSRCRQNVCDLKCVPPADIFGRLQEAEKITPRPLNQRTIWKVNETKQEDPPSSKPAVLHTCAPAPGWKVVNGITVPKSVCSPDIPNLEANDSNLAVWFCTKWFLSPLEKPPNFEMCSSCSVNYYFPFPPTLPKDWVVSAVKV